MNEYQLKEKFGGTWLRRGGEYNYIINCVLSVHNCKKYCYFPGPHCTHNHFYENIVVAYNSEENTFHEFYIDSAAISEKEVAAIIKRKITFRNFK